MQVTAIEPGHAWCEGRGERRRVNTALVQALKDPKVNKTLLDQGAEPNGSSPEAHDKFNRAEIQKWIKVARAAGIEAN